MSYPYTLLITEVTGNVLAATDYNNEHTNHINNNIPGSIDDDSANVAGMQATVNPGGVGTESLAADLKGELERLRYIDTAISGEAQWYVSPGTTLKTAVSYLLSLAKYRRPVLQYNSGSVVNVETGLDGTSGDCLILFPDNTVRTDSDTTRIRCTLSQNAVFTNATRLSNVGGLRTGAVAANTWYSFYAVKVTAGSGASTDFVIVADTVIPTQANYATLNSNFGTNGWVYLGALCYGDNSSATTAIPTFRMSGNKIVFRNSNAFGAWGSCGITLAHTAGATTLTWTYAAGTALASGQVPAQLVIGDLLYTQETGGSQIQNAGTGGSPTYFGEQVSPGALQMVVSGVDLLSGARSAPGASVQQTINLFGYIDSVLGVGSNPLL